MQNSSPSTRNSPAKRLSISYLSPAFLSAVVIKQFDSKSSPKGLADSSDPSDGTCSGSGFGNH